MNLLVFFAIIFYLIFCLYYLDLFFASIHFFKQENPFLTNQGIKFQSALTTFNVINLNRKEIVKIQNYNYKYFTLHLSLMITICLRDGLPLKRFTDDLKNKLNLDLTQQKKIETLIKDALLNIVFIVILTWANVFLFKALIELKLDYIYFTAMIFLQVFGLISFCYLALLFKKKIFSSVEKIIINNSHFQLLIEAKRPLNQAISESHLLDDPINQNEFSELKNKLVHIIDKTQKLGLSPREDLILFDQSLFDQYAQKMQEYSSRLQWLKFLHLALFYLSAYFIFLFSILKFFMEQ